jgi:capsular exopolysaccharide synthesis family protein
MRSRRVADRAVALLARPTEEDIAKCKSEEERRNLLDGARGMSDFLVEVNFYRPLEVFLRAFRGERGRCRVELQCDPLPDGQGGESYEFRFVGAIAGDRHLLDVSKTRQRRFGTDSETERVEIASGEPFTAFRRTFTLEIDGDPTGRAYAVTLRSREELAKWMQLHLTVAQLGRNTGIVSLGSRAKTPRLAQAAAWALAHSFHDTKQSQKREDAGRAFEFLEERVAAVEGDVRAAEEELGRYQSEQGLFSDRTKLYIDNISSLEHQRVQLELHLEEQQQRASVLADKVSDSNGLMAYLAPDDPAAAALAERLVDLELEYQTDRSRLTDEHPEVKAVLLKARAARERLREHLLLQARGTIDALKVRLGRVHGEMASVEELARLLPTQEKELAQLTRKAATLAALHSFLLQKKHEAEIAQESVFSNVRIVDDPVMPGERVSPNLLVNLLVGLFLGFLAALATAFFAEYLDRSVKSPEELERALGLALYAALPAFKSVRSRELRKLKTAMVTIEKPHCLLAEGYRSLRANIRFADFESPVRVFAITSAVLGEGKTTTTLNLAVVLAQAGSRVLVVDADLRRPATHVHLNGSLSPGLSDVLLKTAPWRSVVRPIEAVKGLDVIHAGEKPHNPGALFDSEGFASFLEEVKREYEYVLFDVPPVLAVSDAASFFRSLDAVFLLVQWRRCPAHVVVAAKEQAERLGAKLRGVIFNGFDARKSARRGYGHYGYYGYYDYYGKYGGYTYGYVSDRGKKGKSPSEPTPTMRR